eukprot:4685671-Ditylum_brightwellii.AAC.1
MCFNNAKTWQLGWFSDEVASIGLEQNFIGNLKGQVNYGNGDTASKVVVKVDDPDSNEALYIGFNHGILYNTNTAEGKNQVTVQTYTGSGYDYSYLLSKMGSGSTFTHVLGSGTVTVTVGTIDLTTGLAPVEISYGCAKVDQSCANGANCCSGLCSGGKPANRVCLANGPTAPSPTAPSPTAPSPTPPTACALSQKNE